ncbi:MAG: peptidoglycan-binding protein [Ilumatobacteraceae bacterium]
MVSARQRSFLVLANVGIAAACLAVAIASGGSSGTERVDAASASTTEPSATADGSAAPDGPIGATDTTETTDTTGASGSTTVPAEADLGGADPTTTDSCVIEERSLGGGSSGAGVVCLQEALIAAGFLEGTASGVYDNATAAAVEKLQTERDLFVDGKVGRETALSLGIWPDEQSMVIRTPIPEPGAVDSYGYPLSTVASSGPDAPPLPAGSGSGRRIVYDRMGQRVWAIDENETVIRSWLVSGRKYNNETPGTHEVYSRSDVSTAWNGKAFLPKMVRWLRTDIGAIGFHAIPLHREDNTPYQTEAELGTRLSGGCQRQANADADFLWDFAQIGTPVVVI